LVWQTVSYGIAEYSALCIQQKAVIRPAFFKRLHCVGDHAVKPAQAVASRYTQKGEISEIENASRSSQRSDFLVSSGEDGGSQRIAIRDELQPRIAGSEVSSQRCCSDWICRCRSELGSCTHW
jgi:hypothetical protein